MGFKRRKTYVLDFSDYPGLTGLEVHCKPYSMGDALEAATLMDGMGANADDPKGQGVALRALLTRLADNIASWNLEADDSDEVLPVSVETLSGLDAELQQALIAGWAQVHSGVSEELGKDSRSTKPSRGVSLPMERLSPLPESL